MVESEARGLSGDGCPFAEFDNAILQVRHYQFQQRLGTLRRVDRHGPIGEGLKPCLHGPERGTAGCAHVLAADLRRTEVARPQQAEIDRDVLQRKPHADYGTSLPERRHRRQRYGESLVDVSQRGPPPTGQPSAADFAGQPFQGAHGTAKPRTVTRLAEFGARSGDTPRQRRCQRSEEHVVTRSSDGECQAGNCESAPRSRVG